MNIFFLLFVLIVIIILCNKNIERYTGFVKQSIVMSPFVEKIKTILIDVDDEKIFQYLQSQIPFQYKIKHNHFQNYNLIQNNQLVTINDYLVYNIQNKNIDIPFNTDLRFICSLKKTYYYFIVKSSSLI